MILRRLLLLVLFLLVCHVQCHFIDTRVHGFTVTATSRGDARVETQLANGDKASCNFKYATSPDRAPVVQEVKSVRGSLDVENIVNELQGVCVTKKIDYWEYEVCFSGGVRQFHHDEVYQIGNRGFVHGKLIVWEDGATCEALHPEKKSRKARVSLTCAESAVTPVLVDVQEVSVCVYEFVISTNKVCGDPSFKKVADAGVFSSSSDTVSEDWFLDLAEAGDGSLICSVYSLELRSSGSKLNFVEFDLSVTPSAVGSSMANQYTARRPGRVPCSDIEIIFEPGHVKNSPDFSGHLAYLKVYG